MIETTSGGVTTNGSGSLDISLFYRKNKEDKEAPLHLAEKDKHSGITGMGGVNVVPSGARNTNKVWGTKRNDYPDGSFISIVIRVQKLKPFRMGMNKIVLRCRKTAPLRRIAVTLPQDENSKMSVVYTEGRFDILSVAQAEKLGFADAHLSDPEDYEDFVTVDVIEKEIAPHQEPKLVKVSVASTGEVKGGVLRVKRKRNIRS